MQVDLYGYTISDSPAAGTSDSDDEKSKSPYDRYDGPSRTEKGKGKGKGKGKDSDWDAYDAPPYSSAGKGWTDGPPPRSYGKGQDPSSFYDDFVSAKGKGKGKAKGKDGGGKATYFDYEPPAQSRGGQDWRDAPLSNPFGQENGPKRKGKGKGKGKDRDATYLAPATHSSYNPPPQSHSTNGWKDSPPSDTFGQDLGSSGKGKGTGKGKGKGKDAIYESPTKYSAYEPPFQPHGGQDWRDASQSNPFGQDPGPSGKGNGKGKGKGKDRGGDSTHQSPAAAPAEPSHSNGANGWPEEAPRAQRHRNEPKHADPPPDPPPAVNLLSAEASRHLTTTPFTALPLAPATQRALSTVMKLSFLTEVQNACIPVAMDGDDVVGQAKTGTGKTLAFLIPVVEALLQNKGAPNKGFQCLTLTPTRELAMQIVAEAEKLLTYHHSYGVANMVGGTNKNSDMRAIAKPTAILVATPGRLLDHLKTSPGMAPLLKHTQFLILDEMDRLLDQGFWRDVEHIIQYLPPPSQRQTLLFSATIPPAVMKIASSIMRPDRTRILRMTHASEQNVHQQVAQQVVFAPLMQLTQTLAVILFEEMAKPSFKVMVFFTTARYTQAMAELFQGMGVPVLEIHSRKAQGHRTRVSETFRTGSRMVLFSSDVSARGMDYPDVSFIIQVGMASSQEQYIHRLGRTARGTGEAGHAMLLLADFERPFLTSLGKLGVKEIRPPPISPQAAAKVDMGRAVLAKPTGEADRATQTYIAWLGFYLSQTRYLHTSAAELVRMANEYIPYLFGLSHPPSIQKSTASKMNLKGVPGVTIETTRRNG